MIEKYTHGQVLGRTKSRTFGQVEAKRKINVLFRIIMMKYLACRSNVLQNWKFAKILTTIYQNALQSNITYVTQIMLEHH